MIRIESRARFERGTFSAGISVEDADALLEALRTVRGNSVYCIGSPDLEAVKIGVAKNVFMRLTQLQVASPYKLQVIHRVSHLDRDEALQVERRAHNKFRDVRLEGEWFNAKAEYVAKCLDRLACDVYKRRRRALRSAEATTN